MLHRPLLARETQSSDCCDAAASPRLFLCFLRIVRGKGMRSRSRDRSAGSASVSASFPRRVVLPLECCLVSCSLASTQRQRSPVRDTRQVSSASVLSYRSSAAARTGTRGAFFVFMTEPTDRRRVCERAETPLDCSSTFGKISIFRSGFAPCTQGTSYIGGGGSTGWEDRTCILLPHLHRPW